MDPLAINNGSSACCKPGSGPEIDAGSIVIVYRCRLPPGKAVPGVQRNPVPPQRWHLTTLSPFLSSPLPSQFLHFCFFLMLGPFWLDMVAFGRARPKWRADPAS